MTSSAWDPRGRLSRAEALQTYCAKCGAAAGEPCTYVDSFPMIEDKSPDALRYRSSLVRMNVERIGQPMSKPHNERHRNDYQRLELWLFRHGSLLVVDESDRAMSRDEHARCFGCGHPLAVRLRDLTSQIWEDHERAGRVTFFGWNHLSGSAYCWSVEKNAPDRSYGFPMTPRPIPGLAVDTIEI